jgi:4-hydroxybenzoate polyprenyltransferase
MDVPAVMGFYAIFLTVWLVVIAQRFMAAGLPGRSLLWLCLGFAAAAAQVAWHYTLIRARTREGCHRAFLNSHWISCAAFVGIVLGLA